MEGGVLTDAIADKAPINTATALRAELLAKYGRWVWFIIAVQEVQDEESWADYLLRLSALQEGIAAPAVQLVPRSAAENHDDYQSEFSFSHLESNIFF